jgi:hypothetical protein
MISSIPSPSRSTATGTGSNSKNSLRATRDVVPVFKSSTFCAPPPPTGLDERQASSVPSVIRSRWYSSTYTSARMSFPAMFAIVAPVARNVLGTRAAVSTTRRSPLITIRRAWPVLKNVSRLNGCAQRVFFTPAPSASTAQRIDSASLASVTGLPSLVPRMKEFKSICGSG